MALKVLITLSACLATVFGGYLNGGAGLGGASLALGASRTSILGAGASFVAAPGPVLPAPGYAAPAQVAIHAPPPDPVPHVAIATRVEPYDPHPQYAFSYDVNDHVTGDSKNQVEHRNGDIVQGHYSLTDPDGSRRTVNYVADPHNGFNAIVSRHPGVAPVAVPAHPIAVHS